MRSDSSFIRLILYIFLLAGAAVTATVAFINHWNIIGIVLVVALLIAAVAIIKVYNVSLQKIAFMFNSIENDDFTFRFTLSSKQFQKNRLLNSSLTY